MNITDIIDKYAVGVVEIVTGFEGMRVMGRFHDVILDIGTQLYTRTTVEKILEHAARSQLSGGTLVRYCFECGTIGTYLPKGALACCPDNRWDYVRQEIAEQACAGFKAMLAAAPSPAKEQG